MGYTCTKCKRSVYGELVEKTVLCETRKQMIQWAYKHKRRTNTVELHIQDRDGDLVYFFRSAPPVEEMYRKDGTMAHRTNEMGL
jgi:hypothetical protein